MIQNKKIRIRYFGIFLLFHLVFFPEKYWSLVGDGSSLTPAAVWLHSMTVAEQFVYILGGSTGTV